MGIAADNLPMSANEEDGPEGIAVDLGEEIASRLNAEAEFISVSQANAIQYLNDGVIDCYIGLAAPDIRTLGQIQSIDMLLDYRIVAVTASWSQKDRLVELSGENICVISGSDANVALDECTAFKAAMGEIKYCDSYVEMQRELTGSTCEAAITDEMKFMHFAGVGRNKFKVIDEPLESGDYIIAFGSRETELCERIQSIYNDIYADGTLNKFKIRWVG